MGVRAIVTTSEWAFLCSVAGISCTESEQYSVSGGGAGDGCGDEPGPLVSLRDKGSFAETL